MQILEILAGFEIQANNGKELDDIREKLKTAFPGAHWSNPRPREESQACGLERGVQPEERDPRLAAEIKKICAELHEDAAAPPRSIFDQPNKTLTQTSEGADMAYAQAKADILGTRPWLMQPSPTIKRITGKDILRNREKRRDELLAQGAAEMPEDSAARKELAGCERVIANCLRLQNMTPREKRELIRAKLGPDGFNILMNYSDRDFPPSDLSRHLTGIGIEFEYSGDWCRAGVRLPENPTSEDWIEALRLLMCARLDPLHPDVKVVFGSQELTGSEMIPDVEARKIKRAATW